MVASDTLLAGGVLALAAMALASFAAFRSRTAWLEIRRLEIERQPPLPAPGNASRIEIADLKERVRNLEAIAAGIEP